jgi:hypothetical protein
MAEVGGLAHLITKGEAVSVVVIQRVAPVPDEDRRFKKLVISSLPIP